MFSEEAQELARQTIRAATAVYQRAAQVAAVCTEAHENEVVVAIVDQNGVFRGAEILPLDELYARYAPLDNQKWLVTFSPQTTQATIEDRCYQLSRSAQTRLETMQRRAARDNQTA
jgi:hypothetical protein